MSAAIVNAGGFGLESLAAMSQGYGGGGHAIAGAIGAALLWAVAASLVGQVYLLGLSLVYLRVTEGLDLTASEAALRATFDDARRRTAELGEKARQAAQRRSAPSAAGGAAAASGTSAATGTTYPPPAFPGATQPAAVNPRSAYGAPRGDEATTLPAQHGSVSGDPDIALPFDEPPAPSPAPSYNAPPAWAPPRAEAPPAVAPLPPAPPLPAATTCPQCLSAVTPEDVFCGVCGYRLK
jgi:hypothetical protein